MSARDPAEAAGAGPGPDPALVSLLAFWADAGVETAFEDAPVNRLARPQPSPARAARPPVAPPPLAEPAAPRPRPTADLAAEVARARQAAAAAGDLAALEAVVRAFETPLRLRGAAAVFARGAVAEPAIAVIGQGPTQEDEAAGVAFAGRPGRLLDRMLAAVGLEQSALIVPTAFWRAGPRSTPAEAEAVCAPFLERALALARPRALLIAGEGALRALTGPGEPILQARGRWLAWRPAEAPDAEPLPALPIFHPDVLMRHPSAKKRAWADLLSLADRLAAS